MRELRSCDFCGGEAAGTFEIVPPELEPTEAEQRRVVLCPDCKDRLETLVEPLLARAGVGGGDSTAGSATSASTPDRESESATDGTPAAGESASIGTDVNDGSDESDTTDEGSATDEGDTTDASEGTDGTDDDGDSRLEDGITFDESAGTTDAGDASATGTASSDDAAVDDDTENGDDASEVTADDAAAAESTANDAEPAGTGSSAGTAGSRPPKAYGKVVRLLRNREFPMKRSAVEELAAGAYELEPGEAGDIVDYAIEQGEFVEKRGKLKRP